MRRRTLKLGVAASAAALFGLLLAGCEVTVSDLEKWRNRPRSEQKFVEWMLEPEASPEVRAKAIEMLVEQWNYEGSDYLPQVAELPDEARSRAIRDALPRIAELLGGAEFGLGGDATGRLRPVQVRDASIVLLNTTEDETTRQAIFDQILVPWLQENYRPCITSTGRHPNSRILSMVGAERGLPTVVRYIGEGEMDDIICQNSYLGEVTWLGDVSEELATAYTERWSRSTPDSAEGQRQFVAAMVTVPESRVLKNWIFVQLLESETPLLPDVVDAFLDYVRPLTDETDAERYASMIQHFDGFLRWIGFQNVVRLKGAEGVTMALNAIPDAGVWGRWGGQIVDDGLRRAADWVCARPDIGALEDPAAVFEAELENNNLVARAIAINCLSMYGDTETIELLNSQLEINAIIPSWGGELAEGEEPEVDEEGNPVPPTTTIGELAAQVQAAIPARLEAEAAAAQEDEGETDGETETDGEGETDGDSDTGEQEDG